MGDSGPLKGERGWLLLLLGLGLVRGLLYLSVVPPWQHYDEPIHFERLFWVAESYFRSPGVTALSLPAEVAASMCELRFWGDRLCGLLPLSYEEPPTLEALGVSSQPLYYYLSAPWQSLFRHMPVEIRLYMGRLVSVVLFVLTLAVAYLLLRDLFPTNLEIRLVVPFLVALIPPFTDVMSALNNDVGAVAMFSFLLWGVVRLIRYGWSPISLTWVIGVALLALLTKRTAATGLAVALAAVLLSCRKARWWIGAAGIGILALTVVIFAFNWSGSASWYELPAPASEPIRVLSNGPLGQYVMCAREGRVLIQELTADQVTALEGQEVTFGGWVRAHSSEETVPVFSVYDGTAFHTQALTVTADWQFHAMTMTVSPKASVLQVRLLPPPGREGMACYDGVVLARGEFPLNEPPRFNGIRGDSGMWGERAFVNILSNGSGEKGWPRLRPWVSSLFRRSGLLHGTDPTLFFQSVLDYRRTGWIYQAQVSMLFRSFWARFGWNHIGLPDDYYRALLVPTVLGVAGAVLFGFRLSAGHFRPWQRRSLALLGLAALLVWWGAIIGYSHPQLTTLFPISIVAARYAYPAIIPTMLFLFLGWRELVPGRWRRFLPLLSVLGVAWLDLVSLMEAILPFYYLR